MRAQALHEDPDQHPGTRSDGARLPSSRAPKHTPVARSREHPAPRTFGGNRRGEATSRGIALTRTPKRT